MLHVLFSILWLFEVFLTIIPFGLVFYCIPLLLLTPVYCVHKKTWYRIEKTLYSILPWAFLAYPARRDYHVRAYGDYKKVQKLCNSDNNDLALIIANHQTPSDIAVLIHFWHRINPKKSHFSDLTWVQDYLLSVIPTGWVSKIHGDFFILQTQDINCLTKMTQCSTSDKTIKESQPVKLRKYVDKIMKRHRFLQFFPEAGLFSNRKAGSQRFSEKHGFPVLEHVALPKTTGFTTIIDELYQKKYLGQENDGTEQKRRVKNLIRLTISYPDIEKPWAPAEMITSSIFCRKQKYAYIHCHVESANNIPEPIADAANSKKSVAEKMREPCEQYLLQQYVEMDKIQEKFYQPSEIVIRKESEPDIVRPDELNSLKTASSSSPSEMESVLDMFLPKFPLYLSYFLACCSLALFIAVPVLICLMMQ